MGEQRIDTTDQGQVRPSPLYAAHAPKPCNPYGLVITARHWVFLVSLLCLVSFS
jgi:hypothetical protein